jgi:cell division protein FtsB
MREFEHKRRIRKILSSPLFLVPMAVVLFFLAKGTWDIFEKDRESVTELRFAQDRLARAQERQAKIADSTQKLKTGSGVEGEIRDRLQMAKAGEQEIVILDPVVNTVTTSPTSPSFLQKIWNFFTIR